MLLKVALVTLISLVDSSYVGGDLGSHNVHYGYDHISPMGGIQHYGRSHFEPNFVRVIPYHHGAGGLLDYHGLGHVSPHKYEILHRRPYPSVNLYRPTYYSLPSYGLMAGHINPDLHSYYGPHPGFPLRQPQLPGPLHKSVFRDLHRGYRGHGRGYKRVGITFGNTVGYDHHSPHHRTYGLSYGTNEKGTITYVRKHGHITHDHSHKKHKHGYDHKSHSYGHDKGHEYGHKKGHEHHGYNDIHKPAPKYDYAYGVEDGYHGTSFSHSEQRDGHRTKGSYSVNLPDGRVQKVSYYTDENGYHPTVTYEGQAKYPQEHKGYK